MFLDRGPGGVRVEKEFFLGEEGLKLFEEGVLVGKLDQDVVFNFWADIPATGIRFVVDLVGERI
jgi:hypothetical protein